MEKEAKQELLEAINAGFNGVQEQFNGVQEQFDDVKVRMNNGFKSVNNRLDNLELKMCNVAYRFELNEIDQRVTKLEKKNPKN